MRVREGGDFFFEICEFQIMSADQAQPVPGPDSVATRGETTVTFPWK